MKQEELIKLLIITDQHSLANELLANLRREGLSLKATGANSETAAVAHINNALWDLVVCFHCEQAPVENILQAMNQANLNTPLIFVNAEGSGKEALSILALGAQDVLDSSDDEKLLFATQREIINSALKKNNRKLAISLKELEARHQLLLSSAQNAFSYIHGGIHIYCNQSYADFFAYESIRSISTTPLLDLVSSEDSARLKELLSKDISHAEKISLTAQQLDASQLPAEMTFTPVRYDGKDCLQLSVQHANGNSEHAEAMKKIQEQDLLTRLYNKPHFMAKIEEAIGNAIKQDVLSSLIIIQVNEFVDIKSTIGKSNTNTMINDISQFLQSSIKKSFSAARLDDYLFGLLLDDSKPQEAIELAGFIKGKINNHITTTALPSLQLSCSIGIAAINDRALDAEDLLSRARVNLNTAPEPVKANAEFRISESLDYKVSDMITYLNVALKEDRFKFLFQPLVNIKGNGSDGYEVLTRMLDSDGNDIPPNEFIPLANLNGMGEAIDKAVLKNAFKQIKETGLSQRLIITITNNSLVSPTFLPWLSEQLQSLRIPSESLVFQISEIDICNSLERSIEFCKGLDELSVHKAVCHFGCAINPMDYLESIKPDYVKLDRTVIRDIVYSTHQKNSVQTLIKKLHKQDIMVVAPQIEDVDLLPVLWEIGADFAQGYCLQGPSQEMNYDFIQNEEITLTAPQAEGVLAS